MSKIMKNILWAFFFLICACYLIRINETLFEYLHVGIPLHLVLSVVFIGLGISQLLRKKPVGGGILEAPPRRECVTDLKAWNQKHGILWIGYGVVLSGSFLLLTVVKDHMVAAMIHTVVYISGLIVYCIYDAKLKKEYLRDEDKETAD